VPLNPVRLVPCSCSSPLRGRFTTYLSWDSFAQESTTTLSGERRVDLAVGQVGQRRGAFSLEAETDPDFDARRNAGAGRSARLN
jgi:hypothetical protein